MKAQILAIIGMLGVLAGASAWADSPSLSAQDIETYKSAFRAADSNRWSEAVNRAAQAHDKTLAKVIQWLRMVRPSTDASFDEITRFIERNPDWPKPDAMRQHAEDAMPDDMPPAQVRAYFERHAPLSATGKIRNAEAVLAGGDRRQGLELLRKAWIEGNLGERQWQIFLAKHRHDIRPEDNIARLDRLLWDGQVHAARTMMRRVDRAHALLAEARLRLQEVSGGVEYAVRHVPAELLHDPGLEFDRLRWRRIKGKDEDARAILMHPPANLVRPTMWWRERNIETHRALSQGYITEALRLAERHEQRVGTPPYADAEWLAGWIALRMLRDAKLALPHFSAMADAVRYPISRARALYWQGRALEAMGKSEGAKKAYSDAATYTTTYYGQLAALQIDPAARPVLPPPPSPTAQQRAAFNNEELVRTIRALGQIGEEDLKEVFIKRLGALAHTPDEAALVADLAVSETRADLAVRLARQTWHGEMPLSEHGYPVRALPHSIEAERALVLAVIRQESAFDERAVSRAGALGLMQLMPATARKMASGLGLGYASHRLTNDPDYNVKVGSAYLSGLLDDFGGNYILALAAYNAGPSRVRQWIRDNGDPRSTQVDVVDWIEMIPFDETRNYVQRVIEALNVYRERLSSRAAAPMDGKTIPKIDGKKNVGASP